MLAKERWPLWVYLKDILFEEEEYTEPIKIRDDKKEEVKVSEKEVAKPTIKEVKFDDDDTIKVNTKSNVKPNYNNNSNSERVTSERELFRENTFKFPEFDEEEFQTSMERPKVKEATRSSNVLDYERKKIENRNNDYNRLERLEKEHTEKKKFRPSPIISPVYGILNQDYKAEDIIDRKDTISIEEVRKRAFESTTKVIKEEKEEKIVKVPKKEEEKNIEKKEDNLDPVVTFFEEKDNIKVEDTSDYKSINDLLEEASEEIPLEDTLEIPATNNLDVIEEELEKIEEETKEKENIEDSLDKEEDNDIFELIDSMYDEREED